MPLHHYLFFCLPCHSPAARVRVQLKQCPCLDIRKYPKPGFVLMDIARQYPWIIITLYPISQAPSWSPVKSSSRRGQSVLFTSVWLLFRLSQGCRKVGLNQYREISTTALLHDIYRGKQASLRARADSKNCMPPDETSHLIVRYAKPHHQRMMAFRRPAEKALEKKMQVTRGTETEANGEYLSPLPKTEMAEIIQKDGGKQVLPFP